MFVLSVLQGGALQLEYRFGATIEVGRKVKLRARFPGLSPQPLEIGRGRLLLARLRRGLLRDLAQLAGNLLSALGQALRVFREP
ncbi:hypothetical protein D3C83_39270 [compost metagenome]